MTGQALVAGMSRTVDLHHHVIPDFYWHASNGGRTVPVTRSFASSRAALCVATVIRARSPGPIRSGSSRFAAHPCGEPGCAGRERAGQHRVAAEGALPRGRAAREWLDVLYAC